MPLPSPFDYPIKTVKQAKYDLCHEILEKTKATFLVNLLII